MASELARRMQDAMWDAELSKMLFEAREAVEMLADMVEHRTGQPSRHERDLVARIDSYRARRGWSPHGFGGEQRIGAAGTADEGNQP